MKLTGGVEWTYDNVIPKFGYYQINISSRKAQLKNMSNPSKFGGQKNIAKLNDLVFIINGEISS